MEENYNKLFDLMVKKFDLHKKQTTTDSLIKKGEINAINKMKVLIESQIKISYISKEESKKNFKDIETSLKKYNIDDFGPKNCTELYASLIFLNTSLNKTKKEYEHLISVEKLFEILDNNLDSSLRDLDLLNTMKDNIGVHSKDVELRLKSGKCALKRPQKEKFPCNNENVEGEKYCKEHLKQFSPDKYFDLFEVKE